MRFSISTKELLKAINMVSRSISNTIPLPSLSGIYMNVEEDKVTLIASDSNISIRTILKNDDEKNCLTIEETGKAVINARYFHDIVQRFSDPLTHLEIIDGTLIELKSGKSLFKINGLNAQDYPPIAFENAGTPFTISTSLISEVVNNVSFACSLDETRPALTGVSLKAEGHELRCSATDSFRLAMKTIPLENELNFNIVVPCKYLDKVNTSLEGTESVTVSIDSQKIAFAFEDTLISARLIDDTYPEVSHLLPKSYTQELTVRGRDLASAIDRCSILKSEGKNIVKLVISLDKVDIRAISQEVGSSFDSIEVLSYTGEPLTISCSGKYLSDAIKAAKSTDISLHFNGELRPIVITGAENESLIQFVSPVRSYD